MVLPMSRPVRDPSSGVYYFRKRVPADLRSIVGRAEVSRSLRTKDPAEAKRRNADELRKTELHWAALRTRPEPLPYRQIVALSGVAYRALMAPHLDDPFEQGMWVEVIRLAESMETDKEARERWWSSYVDDILLEHGIVADTDSRERLIVEANRAWLQAAQTLLRNAQGDFTPDPLAQRFPPPPQPQSDPQSPSSVSLTGLFGLWRQDHLAEGRPHKTAADFRQKVQSLAAFIGHDDATRLTGANISDWCAHLRHEKGLSSRTVGQKYLVAVKAVLQLGKDRRKLAENPADGVRFRVTKPRRERSRGFTDQEAKTILTAALSAPETPGRTPESTRMALRWGPWICAYTGARIGEVMQLRREDLIDESGILCLRITPEAGSVKTGNFRTVPIHPHLAEMGLPDFIRSRPNGHLFFTLRPGDDPATRAKNVGKKLSEWVRKSVGITDPRIQPNHAWRHRFKTVCREAGIAPEYADALQGHEDGRASSAYGENTVNALWREVQKLPRYVPDPRRGEAA